ncbi:MAG: hypothetical protein WC320_00960 [Candidatus Paceibacterota bacterium]|jgi:hypothetical protein
MVAHDEKFKEFSENYRKWSDKELFDFRKKQVQYLFAGMAGSQDQEERKALIELVDKEFEMRFKKKTVTISILALIISFISIIISILSCK